MRKWTKETETQNQKDREEKDMLVDKNLEMVNVDPLAIGITRRSKDQGADATSFGHHLLELGS